jgi:opine dehydrogenase
MEGSGHVAEPVVAVIGAGNVGCALAAHLTLRGASVRLCTRSEARLAPIREAGAITLTGAVSGPVRIATLTTSVREAVTGADVVAVTVPTPALPFYAAPLAEACGVDQLLWLNPGHSGGALFLVAEFERLGGPRGMRMCQLSTASHGSRMTGPAAVRVFRLSPATLAAFPAEKLDECYERVDALLPGQFGQAGTVLELDLMNINAIMHPAQMVCNASWIEATSGDFCIYQEGTGPAVGRVMDAVDAERLAIAERLGVPATPLGEILCKAGYTTKEAAATGQAYPALQAGEAIRGVKAPPTLDHRYLHEDVGWGLVPWLGFAEAAAVATPTTNALIDLAGVINGVDYRAIGLTLDKMGLRNMGPEQIVEYVRTGTSAESSS